MPSVSDILTQATGRLNSGQFEEAARLYLEAVRSDPGHDQAWLGLALALALQRQPEPLLGLAARRETLRRDGFAYVHDVLTMLMGYRLYRLVHDLCECIADDSPYAPAGLYHAGCLALLEGEEDAAFARFRRLKPLLAERRAALPVGPEHAFNIAYRQATLVEDGDYIAALREEDLTAAAAALPPLAHQGPRPAGAAAYAVLAACDGRYFERFAEAFLDSLEAQAEGVGVHIHVVEPTAAATRLMAGLGGPRRRNPLSYSTEGPNPYRSGAYYACSRFLVGPALQGEIGKPLLVADLDIAFTRPLDEIAAAAGDADFASFVHDGPGPCSRLPAVLTWFNATAEGVAALAAVRAFILSKLEVRWPFNWMLDQAALMGMRRYLRRYRPAARIGVLNERLGGPFSEVLRCLGEEEEKAALIRAVPAGAAVPGTPT